MKKLLLLAMSVAALSLNAQVYTNYWEGATAGDYLVDYMNADDVNDIDDLWANCEKAGYDGGTEGKSPIFSSEDNLRYSGYIGSEMGISVRIDSSNEDDAGTRIYTRGFQISGEDTLKFMGETGTDQVVYAAFLIKPLAYDFGSMRDVFQFEMSGTGNWSRARAFMDIHSGTAVQFGVGKKDSPVNDGDTTTRVANGVGDTYLVVLKYEQVAGGPDPGTDIVSLCVNPDLSKTEAEQDFIFANSADKDYNGDGVLKMNICQRGHTADIGCIRVGSDWTEVLLGVAATGVALDLETLEVAAGAEAELVATVLPAGNAADASVTWSSSDETVATVDAYGVVKGIAAGTATITATSNDGSFTADCAVTVTGESAVNNVISLNNSVYPNPSNGVFTIANQEGSDVFVSNVAGQVVYQQSGISNNELIVTNLSTGVYFISVVNAEGKGVSKLIIE